MTHRPLSSGDTIPNCLGGLGEIRERTGIAADGHPVGAPGATGVERLRPRENVQRLGGSQSGRVRQLRNDAPPDPGRRRTEIADPCTSRHRACDPKHLSTYPPISGSKGVDEPEREVAGVDCSWYDQTYSWRYFRWPRFPQSFRCRI